MEKYIKTNIGEIPIEDYIDIISKQYGFDDYDDLVNQGYFLEIAERYKIESDIKI